MYQIVNDPMNGQPCAIKRAADGVFIPLDPNNTDYADYLAWVAEGNAPSPAEGA